MSPPWSVRKRIGVAVGVVIATPIVIILAGIALFAGYLFLWFNEGALFSGDGTYRKGVDGAAFQVEFPTVDLSRRARHTFNFTHLGPEMGYSVGLRVLDRDQADLADSSALVAMSLRNERGETVFSQQHRLKDWNWRGSLAVINGRSVEVPIGGGSVRIENEGVGPDGGWGTHFTPRWSGRYQLVLDILEPDPAVARRTVHPVIEGYTGSL